MKTLKTFLNNNSLAATEIYDFAENLTIEQFLETCERGDWILLLFTKTNPNSLKERKLVKEHSANIEKHLMLDEKTLNDNVDNLSQKFREGRATIEEVAAAASSAIFAANANYARQEKQTADICRKFLPIEIWDQSQF